MPAVIEGHPHGPMRRKDREITEQSEINAIIKENHLMHIALADKEIPFLVPVFYGFDGTALYFHSAQAGTKIEIIKRNPNICFEISEVEGFIESDLACDFEAKHKTIIGFGKAVFVQNDDEKIKALNLVVAHFSKKQFDFPKENLNRTIVVRIDIASMKGKKHGV